MLLIGYTIETNFFYFIFNVNYDPLIDYLTGCRLILDVKPSRDNEYTQQNLPFTF